MDLRELAPDEETLASDVALTPENSVDTVAEEVSQSNPVADETASEEVAVEPKEFTKETVIERLTEISQADGADIARDEISRLKQVFYNLRKNELLAEKQAFIEAGNEETAFAPMPDEMENRMHELLDCIKEKKAQYAMRLEAERAENLQKKPAIIA